MIPRKRKEVNGKLICDVCEEERPPIHEYEFRLYDHLAHWLDLCDECGSVDRGVKGGFLAGIHYDRKPVQKSNTTRRERTPQRAKGAKRLQTPGTSSSKPVERAVGLLNAKREEEAAG